MARNQNGDNRLRLPAKYVFAAEDYGPHSELLRVITVLNRI